jgi:hypothetical protein
MQSAEDDAGRSRQLSSSESDFDLESKSLEDYVMRLVPMVVSFEGCGQKQCSVNCRTKRTNEIRGVAQPG